MKSGVREERERNIEWGRQGSGRESERNEREKNTEEELQERSHTCINLDKTGLIDYLGNILYLPDCNLK